MGTAAFLSYFQETQGLTFPCASCVPDIVPSALGVVSGPSQESGIGSSRFSKRGLCSSPEMRKCRMTAPSTGDTEGKGWATRTSALPGGNPHSWDLDLYGEGSPWRWGTPHGGHRPLRGRGAAGAGSPEGSRGPLAHPSSAAVPCGQELKPKRSSVSPFPPILRLLPVSFSGLMEAWASGKGVWKI